ncbi:PCI domain-containing protein [Xylariaceae sp. FL0662B]|nr:PCI domain-containing protein [Xylariaceae sp. FL0662B]
MEQTKALNALEPFLALTKSATAPRAAADLVTQATSNPNTYVFAELLQAPQIQALAESPDYASYLALLEIFSYGTFATYASTPNLPALNDAQMQKLRQLSLLTLAKDPQSLSYASLQHQLGLSDARAVEDLIINTIYADLVTAQLDPRNGAVHVSRVAPLRDLEPQSIPAMLNSLRTWSGRCTSTLSDLEAQIAAVKADAAQRHSEKKTWETTMAQLVEEQKTQEVGGGGGGAGGGAHSWSQSNLLNRAVARLNTQRYGKRGSGSMEPGPDGDEAMDLDEEEPDDGESSANGTGSGGGKKRASSRRKVF